MIQSFTQVRIYALILALVFSITSFSPSVLAYSTSSSRYSSKASTYVDSYIARLQRAGYSTAEITTALINLRSSYIKKQKSGLYRGSALQEIDAVIEELDSAIAGVSEGSCGTCDIYDDFGVDVPQRYYRDDTYRRNNDRYIERRDTYQRNDPYRYQSSASVRVSDVTLSSDGYSSTEVRTSLIRDAVNSINSSDYDVYRFDLQSNGYSSNQPASSRFLAPSSTRQFTTRQGRSLSVSFASTQDANTVRSLRTTADASYRSSQSSTTAYGTFTDIYTSPSPDEFARQAISNGYNSKMYRIYRLYISRDNSHAFLVEYIESGSSNTVSFASQTIRGIDTASFSDYGSYFTHTYSTSQNNSSTKRYKHYIYIPTPGSDPRTVLSNLGVSYRTTYQMGTTRMSSINGYTTNTTINGYTVRSEYMSSLESLMNTYGYSTSLISLPGSQSQISFSPVTGYAYSVGRLTDGTYRMYRLLVAEDGSDAYLTEYIEQSQSYYY